jgi:AraC-like DNA-binding protein
MVETVIAGESEAGLAIAGSRRRRSSSATRRAVGSPSTAASYCNCVSADRCHRCGQFQDQPRLTRSLARCIVRGSHPISRISTRSMALERRLSVVTEADISRLTTAVGAMIAAAVAPSAERVAVARGQIDVGRKERVRQAVRRHLRTPTLGPTNLCRLVGMSRSNLYRLFEDTGGVARYIQRERLLEAHAVLTDPATTESISAIAEDLCFADASSFSRTFKREFGHSPGEMRAATFAGLALPATPRGPVPSSARADFSELLRGF